MREQTSRLLMLLIGATSLSGLASVAAAPATPNPSPGPNEPESVLPMALVQHLQGMKTSFCPYCIDYCLTGVQPDLPVPSSTSTLTSPSPLQPLQPELLFEHWRPLPELGLHYLGNQAERWLAVQKAAATTTTTMLTAQQWERHVGAWFRENLEAIVLEFLTQEGWCKKDNGGPGPGRPAPNTGPLAEADWMRDLTAEWYAFVRQRGTATTTAAAAPAEQQQEEWEKERELVPAGIRHSSVSTQVRGSHSDPAAAAVGFIQSIAACVVREMGQLSTARLAPAAPRRLAGYGKVDMSTFVR
ncbi:MAG: hypothetical protein M1826_005008 [Phylliscum demangeonii]|nr:MAG: hypothetical protein M1826_005008 [Phylliscum demangeonii]